MLTGAAILLVLSRIFAEPWAVPAQPATWAAIGYLVTFGSVAIGEVSRGDVDAWHTALLRGTTPAVAARCSSVLRLK